MKWWRWRYLAVLSPTGLGLAAWALLSSALIVSLEGPLREVSLAAGIALSAIAIPYTFFGVREVANAAKQAQMQAEQHRRFLASLDHELKNPLTAIHVGVDGLVEVVSDPDHLETLATVKGVTERLISLVVNLRKLSQLEDIPFDPEPVNVESLLMEVYEWAQRDPKGQDRELAYSPAAFPLSGVEGEEDLLYLALRNLVDNAMKFTRSGDRVEMRAFDDGANVHIQITDTGPGIPESEIPHIWDPLFRGEIAARKRVPGHGLGLALVRAIVDRHGGRIGVRSREGQGTAFTLRLPVIGSSRP